MHEGKRNSSERYRDIAEKNGELDRIREHDSGEHKSGKRAWDKYAFSEEYPERERDLHDAEAVKEENVTRSRDIEEERRNIADPRVRIREC